MSEDRGGGKGDIKIMRKGRKGSRRGEGGASAVEV